MADFSLSHRARGIKALAASRDRVLTRGRRRDGRQSYDYWEVWKATLLGTPARVSFRNLTLVEEYLLALPEVPLDQRRTPHG